MQRLNNYTAEKESQALRQGQALYGNLFKSTIDPKNGHCIVEELWEKWAPNMNEEGENLQGLVAFPIIVQLHIAGEEEVTCHSKKKLAWGDRKAG